MNKKGRKVIAVNAVFLNEPDNNFHKFTVKTIELLAMFDIENIYYLIHPLPLTENLFSKKLPDNFIFLEDGASFYIPYAGNLQKKNREAFENSIPDLLQKQGIKADIIFTPYNFFPENKCAARYWTVFHDVIPLLPLGALKNRQCLDALVYSGMKETLRWIKKRKNILNNDVLFSVSETEKAMINLLTPWKKTIYLFKNYISPGYITAEKPDYEDVNSRNILNGLGISKPYLLYVGSMTARKNTDTLIKAFKLLSEKTQDTLQLILAGGNTFRSGHIIGTGFIEEKKLPVLFKNCLCYISVSKYEGFGVPPLEALFCGKPLILSELPVCREIFGNIPVYTGYRNPEEVRDAILSMLSEKQAAVERALKGLSRIREQFSEKAAVKDFLMLINSD
ncbi:MAG: hypothetical protein A2096_15470 [Spirochaetes bacterium GWF1_41_5]|nr:MAG: hypothetical protein A2096_15470 [Spirochaetes bacterium GWF1_41_5]